MKESFDRIVERYCLLGHPVGHSLSPVFQNAGFRALGLGYSYGLRDVLPEDLGACFSDLRSSHYGWNVTIPHKEAAVGLVDELDDVARVLGSVNTVVNEDGYLRGYSTDGYGLERSLEESFGVDLRGLRLCFLGCGGAARACSIYAAMRGAGELILVNRTRSRAEALCAEVIKAGGHARVVDYEAVNELSERLHGVDVLVQCTSLGLRIDDPLPYPVELLPAGLLVVDMIYGESRFLRLAESRGHRTTDGRGMLLHQGCRSFELWTGRSAPVEAMRSALWEALSAGGKK